MPEFFTTTLPGALLLFVIGLAAIIWGGDRFVEAATSIAHKFKIPSIVIGATLVSIATTLPETVVSLMAHLIDHNSAVSFGNAVGSYICNIGLIFGIVVTIKSIGVNRGEFLPNGLFMLSGGIIILLFGLLSQIDGGGAVLPRSAGLILVVILLLFFVFNTMIGYKNEKSEDENPVLMKMVRAVFLFIVGAGLILVGSRLLIDGATAIARHAGIPDRVIALSLVAFGTSTPELATSIIALLKGRGGLSAGNIIGANTLNMLQVLGFSALFRPLPIPQETLFKDLPIMLFFGLLLLIFGLSGNRFKRWEGISLTAVYVAYMVNLTFFS